MRCVGATCLIAVLVTTTSCRDHDRDSRAVERCRVAGDGTLRRPGLEVYVESRVERDGAIRSGRVPTCGDGAAATARFLSAHDALERTPPTLRPKHVVVHVAPALPRDAPPLGAIETHQTSGSVLVTGDRAVHLTQPMWLHEYGHLLMLGQKPKRGTAAASIFDAVEEGVADYYAACVQESPDLGAGGDGSLSRDLRSRPHGVAAGWDALALADRRFEVHRFGWDLAARLWKREPRRGPLLEDLLRCVADARFTTGATPPSAVAGALLNACPERSRDAFETVLAAWLPPALGPKR